jgi:16S rRNA G527 N7-methylase RsmG
MLEQHGELDAADLLAIARNVLDDRLLDLGAGGGVEGVVIQLKA